MASTSCFARGCRALMASKKSSAAANTTASPAAAKGILKAVPISPALGKFLGASEVSRTQAVKKVWEYIKQSNLQIPENKKVIRCDDKLKTIFNGRDSVGFLEIARLLSQHFQKAS